MASEELWDTFVCLDTETGGVNPRENQILTLDAQAVRLVNGKLETLGGAFHGELAIDPELKLDPRALEVNGINPQTWQGIRPSRVLGDFVRWVRSACGQGYVIPMGFNVCFDLDFLREEFRRHPAAGRLTDALSYRSLDVMQLAHFARALGYLPQMPSMKLTDLCQALGIPVAGAHSSAVDVRLTIDLFNAIASRLPGPVQPGLF